jgi:membrane dipeptidase
MDISKEEEIRALEIHSKAIIINGLDPTKLDAFSDDYIQDLKKGGFTGICFSLISPEETVSLSQAVRQVADSYLRFRDLGPDKVKLTMTVREIKEAKEKGRIAVIFSSQGSGYLEFNLSNIEVFHKLGMRIMQPTYQRRNQFGDGCAEKKDAGLSNLGINWVEEMNRLHMLISLSHVGFRSSMEVMEISKDPVIFSHANPRALCSHVRNITDEQIKACAEKGGVIGLLPLASFLRDDKGPREIGLSDYLDHVAYMVNLVGVDHVGFGVDLPTGWFFTPVEILERRRKYPEMRPPRLREVEDEFLKSGRERLAFYEVQAPWFSSMTQMPMVTKGLVAKGYSDEEIVKILGGNFLRVFGKVWGS